MKLKNLIACFFLGFIMVSCIQDEAPNAEADIETCTVPGDVLNRDPIIGNDQITLPLKKERISVNLLRNLHSLPALPLIRKVGLYATSPHHKNMWLLPKMENGKKNMR